MTICTLALSFFILAGERPQNIKDSLKALLTHLEIGPGSTVEEIGAGRGNESCIFADIVGTTGHVFSEEVDKGKVKHLKELAKQKKYTQMEPVLGKADNTNIPDKRADLVFMRRVYHHFSKPRPMLRSIWHDLKPGGFLVIVDRHRGTLRDWVPRERRAKKHFWIAETTVVREAREEGFAFVECGEKYWSDKTPFVVVFRRPKGIVEPKGDPDPFLPIDVKSAQKYFASLKKKIVNPIFVALGKGRKLIKPILKLSSGKPAEIILEEWATQKTERPPSPKDLKLPIFFTDMGDPHFTGGQSNAVFFLDTYHLLFHTDTLLPKIREKLSPGGHVYIMDRLSKKPLSHRLASHRRKITPGLVKKEMGKAGYRFLSKGPQFAKDRFLLVFEKKQLEKKEGVKQSGQQAKKVKKKTGSGSK